MDNNSYRAYADDFSIIFSDNIFTKILDTKCEVILVIVVGYFLIAKKPRKTDFIYNFRLIRH